MFNIKSQYNYLHTVLKPKKLRTFDEFNFDTFECKNCLDYYSVALHYNSNELLKHGLDSSAQFQGALGTQCLFPWYLNPICFSLLPIFWIMLRLNLLVDLFSVFVMNRCICKICIPLVYFLKFVMLWTVFIPFNHSLFLVLLIRALLNGLYHLVGIELVDSNTYFDEYTGWRSEENKNTATEAIPSDGDVENRPDDVEFRPSNDVKVTHDIEGSEKEYEMVEVEETV